MANSWLRLWHDMPNDPKWRSIARASKQSIPSVMAVYLHLLVNASNATERGRTQSVCNEDIASALDLEIDQIDAIIKAMQGRVLDGELISGWSKRQVDREDGGAERARAWREAKKGKENGTQPNATERNRTPDKDKDKDKDKELKTNSTFVLPDFISSEDWNLWIKTRKGKKLNDEQKQGYVEKLEKWMKLGLDHKSALKDAALAGWQGLHEPKNGYSKSPKADNFENKDYGTGVNPL